MPYLQGRVESQAQNGTQYHYLYKAKSVRRYRSATISHWISILSVAGMRYILTNERMIWGRDSIMGLS